MFNGAPVVTHELAPFVEVLDWVRFFKQPFGHRNAMKCCDLFNVVNVENLQKRRTILGSGSSSG